MQRQATPSAWKQKTERALKQNKMNPFKISENRKFSSAAPEIENKVAKGCADFVPLEDKDAEEARQQKRIQSQHLLHSQTFSLHEQSLSASQTAALPKCNSVC